MGDGGLKPRGDEERTKDDRYKLYDKERREATRSDKKTTTKIYEWQQVHVHRFFEISPGRMIPRKLEEEDDPKKLLHVASRIT